MEINSPDDLEIYIRGRFMQINCGIEFLLYGIMVGCNRLTRIKEFKGMQMHNKIECAISDLKKFHPDLYEEYKNELEQLWVFKDFRNDICHRPMKIDEDFELITFAYFNMYNGEDDAIEEKRSVEGILLCIVIFQKLADSIHELLDRLKDRTSD
jgi:hypothetical protein